jgi:hypothetical protein
MLKVSYNLISYLNCVSHIIGYESSVAAVLFCIIIILIVIYFNLKI